MKKKDIVKTPSKKLTKKQLKQLASFTDPGTILVTLSNEGWTIEESIKHLVSIANGVDDESKPSTQLAAIRYLNQLIVDTMERSGLMVMATKKFIGKKGEEVRLSGQLVSSILRGQKEQTSLAELASGTNKNLNTKEEKNDNSRPKRIGPDSGRQKGESRSDLHTSKAPTGQQTEDGHFNGISQDNASSFIDKTGDFL